METENGTTAPEEGLKPDDTTAETQITEATPEGGAPEGGAPEAKPPEPEPDQNIDLAKKFNKLTEDEKVLRGKEETLKTEREEFASQQEALAGLKENPLKALKAMGISFKDLAQQVLNDEEPTTEQKLKTLEEQVLADKKTREERDAKQEQDWAAYLMRLEK